jgi:hypothetical protein
MNGTPAKIEIFAPFGAAYEWMKGMLFRPFDVARWLTIAFAAFLAGGTGGSGSGNLGRLGRFGDGDWKYSSHRYGDFSSDWNVEPWLIAGVVALVVCGLVLAIVWMWVNARGRFIFTDCIVKNRAAIKEPWREFRREGNSYFLFVLVVAAGMIFLIGTMVLVAMVPLQMLFGGGSGDSFTIPLIILCVLLALIWLVLVIFFALVSSFMVPVMYRRRCLAREAFFDVLRLITHNPGPFILFVLFGIVLAMGVGVIGTVVACMTCCVGAFPYVSTVLLLPAIVWLAAFKLLFLRQFGDQYDVWAPVAVTTPATEPLPPTSPA